MFRNMHIVLDPNTSDSPVLVQHLFVDVFCQLGILEERVKNEVAEIDLTRRISAQTSQAG